MCWINDALHGNETGAHLVVRSTNIVLCAGYNVGVLLLLGLSNLKHVAEPLGLEEVCCGISVQWGKENKDNTSVRVQRA